EILVLGPVTLPAPGVVAPPGAALVLTAAAQALPRALRLLHRTHLVEGALHGLEGTVRLPALERLDPLGPVAAPVTALAPEPLHRVEQLAAPPGRAVRAGTAQP